MSLISVDRRLLKNVGGSARYWVVLEQPSVITSIDGLQLFMIAISKKRLHSANEAVGETLRILDVDD